MLRKLNFSVGAERAYYPISTAEWVFLLAFRQLPDSVKRLVLDFVDHENKCRAYWEAQ